MPTAGTTIPHICRNLAIPGHFRSGSDGALAEPRLHGVPEPIRTCFSVIGAYSKAFIFSLSLSLSVGLCTHVYTYVEKNRCMQMCVRVYMRVYMYMYICIFTDRYTCMHTYVHISLYVMYIYIYIYLRLMDMCIYLYTHMYLYTCVCIQCMHACMHAFLYLFLYIYVHGALPESARSLGRRRQVWSHCLRGLPSSLGRGGLACRNWASFEGGGV